MGCATSKQKNKVCRNCHTPYSPVRRSYSLHGNRHPKYEDDDDVCHVVALTSSTLGSLKLDLLDQNHHRIKEDAFSTHNKDDNAPTKLSKEEFAKGVVEAMSWSKMIDEKIPKVIPKTPTRTPPGEPETINAWELMEGLEDSSPLRPPQSHHHFRSFSFNLQVSNRIQSLIDQQSTPRVRDDDAERQNPIWEEDAGGGDADDDASNSNSNDTSIVSDFDPEVISTFRKALEELPPANPFHLKPLLSEKPQASDGNNNDTLEAKTDDDDDSRELDLSRDRVRGKDKLIVYFTSLRGVRKTYEDCCNVRLILKALGVKIDERDVSMHSGFKEELKELLGEGWYSGGALPKVFIGSKYIGGAEEISRMHEHGQLEKLVEGCELVEDGGGGGGVGGGGNGVTCEACGDIRFVPCDTCSGSCKIYCEGDYDDDDEDENENEKVEEEIDNGFQRCPDCNENGLIRCPICCD